MQEAEAGVSQGKVMLNCFLWDIGQRMTRILCCLYSSFTLEKSEPHGKAILSLGSAHLNLIHSLLLRLAAARAAAFDSPSTPP